MAEFLRERSFDCALLQNAFTPLIAWLQILRRIGYAATAAASP